MATPAQIAGGQLLATTHSGGKTVSSILGDGGLSAGDHPYPEGHACGWQGKIGKIVVAVNHMIGEALDEAGTQLSGEDQARIREILANITGSLEALAGVEIVEEFIVPPEGVVEEGAGESLEFVEEIAGPADAGDPAGTDAVTEDASASATPGIDEIIEDASAGSADEMLTGAQEGSEAETGVKASMGRALEGIVQALQDTGTDITGKAGKIMTAFEGLLSDAIDAAGSGLSDDQAGQLKQIFHEMMEGAGAAEAAEGMPEADKMATAARIAGGELLEDVSSILGDGTLSARDKISRIMTAVNELIDNTLSGNIAGLSKEDQAHIREMMANITGNLEALADETLAGMEIVEETDLPPAHVPSGAGVVEEGEILPQEAAGQSAEGPAEIIQDFSASPAEAFADGNAVTNQTGSTVSMETEVIDATDQAGAGEFVEWIEETAGEDSVADGDIVIAETDSTAAGNDGAEFIEVDGTTDDGPEKTQDGIATEETSSAEAVAEIASAEDFQEQDFVEEIVEDTGDAAPNVQVTPTDKDIDSDLLEKTDLLTRLAEAAGVLSGMGPDLSGSVYTEEEIRGKAQFLSEEFDRYLSIRDKFYNAHILIKGGDYLVGGAHLSKSVLAEQIVTLPDFYISKFPITNALFEIFVEQTGYVTTAEKYGYSLVYFPRMQRSRDPITGVERFSLHNQAYSKKVPGACWHRPHGPDSSLYLKRTHPVVHVSLEDASAFAVWTGKRLPSEIEWEASARMAQGLTYPWGSKWQDDACNIEKSLHGDTTPVDRYAKFANSAGVADMLGNVLEWTSDVIGDTETSDTFIVKGAGWIAHDEISLTDRHYIEKNMSSNILGFRCVAI